MAGETSAFGDAATHAASDVDQPPDRVFAGKVAVVTGSTQGLGLTAVRTMLRRGLAGAVISGRNAEAGESAARQLSSAGARVVYHRADLSDLDDCRALIARAVAEFGSFDILVNSAGITDRGGILDGDAALWQRTFDINARAPFFLIQHAADHWIARGKPGSVVNVATVTAHGGVPFLAVYAASKAALIATTKNAGFSLARHGIRVNALAIGWMDTPAEDVTQKTFHDMPDGWQEQAGKELPAGRLLDMNEVARWIAHLAGPESGIMTGSVIDFDHGVVGCYEATPLPKPLG
ncbi:SDR family oxidoreductase [Roseivivax isoporae]|uniref:Short-chain dehydrogenase n=1 Tax=Roseivivax isoporae LMG 25204 TaxID=1449351 RepID=X7F965_9RHOB|nr:SDR family oxidoreductase [Roseivivax isoporae]ETX28636.1 short-chain dehydrogenase [Roseivivax isoporae LMG 25204]